MRYLKIMTTRNGQRKVVVYRCDYCGKIVAYSKLVQGPTMDACKKGPTMDACKKCIEEM